MRKKLSAALGIAAIAAVATGCGGSSATTYADAAELQAALNDAKPCSLVESDTDTDEESGAALSTFSCRASGLPGSDYNMGGVVVVDGDVDVRALADDEGGMVALVGENWFVHTDYAFNDDEKAQVTAWLEGAQEKLGGEIADLD